MAADGGAGRVPKRLSLARVDPADASDAADEALLAAAVESLSTAAAVVEQGLLDCSLQPEPVAPSLSSVCPLAAYDSRGGVDWDALEAQAREVQRGRLVLLRLEIAARLAYAHLQRQASLLPACPPT